MPETRSMSKNPLKVEMPASGQETVIVQGATPPTVEANHIQDAPPPEQLDDADVPADDDHEENRLISFPGTVLFYPPPPFRGQPGEDFRE